MKKKLLIYWTSRTFFEVVAPLIPRLAVNFRVVVVLFNFSSPPDLMERLNKMKEQGHIENYFLTPEYNKLLKFHLFWRSKIKDLCSYDFDCLLSSGEAQVGERYLIECVLPKKCVVVCMCFNITHLFINTQATSDSFVRELDSTDTGLLVDERVSIIKMGCDKIVSALKRGELFSKAKLAFLIAPLLFKKKIVYFLERILLPWMVAGKIFLLGPFDRLTQFSSGRSDALILFNKRDAEVYRKLLAGQKVYVAQNPNINNCRCSKISSRELVVLSPLSGFIGNNQIDGKWMQLFYRDYKIALSQTGAKKLHLRLHPDESGEWSCRLQEYLVSRGIDATIVGCDKPIRDIMCDYLGFVGYSSSSLRDARASCDYAVVIGFTAVSNYQFKNPKYNFGDPEGINWIEKDGSFEPGIFARKRFVSPNRKSVPELLMEISKRG